jgi:hypothetical protein
MGERLAAMTSHQFSILRKIATTSAKWALFNNSIANTSLPALYPHFAILAEVTKERLLVTALMPVLSDSVTCTTSQILASQCYLISTETALVVFQRE